MKLDTTAQDGGVANMIHTIETADIIYDEVYVTTPAMISRKAELDKLRNNTFLSMVMGETPVSDFDKFVEQWKAQGGDEIAKEVNEWYQCYPAFYLAPNHATLHQIKKRHSINYSDGFFIRLLYAVPFVLS